jgi:hypothetical protein
MARHRKVDDAEAIEAEPDIVLTRRWDRLRAELKREAVFARRQQESLVVRATMTLNVGGRDEARRDDGSAV